MKIDFAIFGTELLNVFVNIHETIINQPYKGKGETPTAFYGNIHFIKM